MRRRGRRWRRAGAGSPRWKRSPPPWPPRASRPASTRPPPPSTPASPTQRPRHPPASPRSPQSSTPCWPSTPPPSSSRSGRGSAPRQALRKIGLERTDPHPVLGHRVALPDGHRLIVQRLEVHGDAVRGADLVLPAVAAADRAGVVEVDVPPLAQLRGQVARLG